MSQHPLAPAEERELGMLFSFHYYGNVTFDDYIGSMPLRPRVFVDSGGFSAHTQGASIDMDDYVRWLRRNAAWIDYYANLDEIGDPRGTLINQLRMERRGMRPTPVIHFGQSSEMVRRYARHGYTYQCLGGMVPHMRGVSQAIRGGREHPLLHWLNEMHEVGREEGVVFHGFGATTWTVLTAYPWRSVDSSSWAAGYRFGQGAIFDWRIGRWSNFKLRDQQQIMAVADLLRSYGVEPLSLVRDDERSRINLTKLAARSWLAAQRWLRGKTVFLASTSPSKWMATTYVSPQVYLVESNKSHLHEAAVALSKHGENL